MVEVDQQIVEYYRAIIPRYIDIRRQKYPAHISVVRKVVPPCLAAWGRHEGKLVEFFYDPYICVSDNYFWLNVFSKHLEEVRLELGLSVEALFIQPPSGFKTTFHITIGNTK